MSTVPQSQLELFESLLRLSKETNDNKTVKEQSLVLEIRDSDSGKKTNSIKIIV